VDLDDINKRLASSRPTTRAKGMEQLIATGNVDLLVAHALAEKDKELISKAADLLFPRPPAELLCHLFSVWKQPTPLRAVEYWLPRSNWLYAEDAIFALYGKKTARLSGDVISAIGLAYLKSFAPSLRKLLDGRMVAAKTAFEKEGAKALRGGHYTGKKTATIKPDGSFTIGWKHDLENTFAGDSQRTVEAAAALRRMDEPVDVGEIDRLIGEADACSIGPNFWRNLLGWVRFDSAADRSFDSVMAGESLLLPRIPDYALTLLKRGLLAEIDALAAKFGPFSMYNRSFCYWPLLDHLEHRGLLKVEEKWLGAPDYLRARAQGIAPPPWWQWIDR
jgi:hypothetical protein